MIRRPPISFVVLYHSGYSYLQACLDSLLASTQDTDEILVIVNNSESAVHNVSYYPNKVKYLHYQENLGYGRAGNTGVKAAKNDHVIICDHDLVFYPGWVDALWHFYQSNEQLAAVCCKIIDTQNNSMLDCGIAFSGFNFSHPFMDLPTEHSLVSKNRVPQMICTGGFLISKFHFELVGGLDESFGSLYTDLDISLSLKRAGYSVGTCYLAVAQHFAGELFQNGKKYKAGFLKSDVKGAFMKKNADMIEIDLHLYYEESARYFKAVNSDFEKYFFCNLMNVANPAWYEDLLISLGAKSYDRMGCATGERDADTIRLFDVLGYDIMAVGVPVAYFIDRFSSIKPNYFWWKQRRSYEKDIVVDRSSNIMLVSDLLAIHGIGKL